MLRTNATVEPLIDGRAEETLPILTQAEKSRAQPDCNRYTWDDGHDQLVDSAVSTYDFGWGNDPINTHNPEQITENIPENLISYLYDLNLAQYARENNAFEEQKARNYMNSVEKRKRFAEDNDGWWQSVEAAIRKAYKEYSSNSSCEPFKRTSPGSFEMFEKALCLSIYQCSCQSKCKYEIQLICFLEYRKYSLCAKREDTSKQCLMKHILTSGFCPSDMTMKVSFSFHTLKTYAQFLMEAQVACYALQC